MFNGIESKTPEVDLFSQPHSPVLDVVFDFRMIVVQVSIHEVVIIALLFIYRLRPVLSIPLDSVNGCLVIRCIEIRTGEMIPIESQRSSIAS